MFIILFWAKNIVSITIHKPLSSMDIWINIIENKYTHIQQNEINRKFSICDKLIQLDGY